MGRRVHGGVNVQRTTYTQLSKSIIMSPSHVLLLISLGLANGGRHYNYGSHHSSSSSRGSSADKTSVASLIGSTPEFSTLFTALGLTSLAATAASQDAVFTVFAPTNAAFKKIPKKTLEGLLADPAALEKVLARHIVVGSKLTSKNIPFGTTLSTAGGESVTADRSNRGIKLTSGSGKASVTKFDLFAGNGVVHAIDTPI